MTIWSEVSTKVLEIAKDLIQKYHPDLKEARVAFVFRDKASKSANKMVLGKASKISDKLKAAGLDYDFLIWLAEEEYSELLPEQQRALIDHELCHCSFLDQVPEMRHHDIEEFKCIIERYGFWNMSLLEIKPALTNALQMKMDFEIPERGAIVTIKPELMDSIEET